MNYVEKKIENNQYGEGSTQIINISEIVVKKSTIYEFCKIFSTMASEIKSEENISNVSMEWEQKMILNELVEYKNIFDEVCINYDTISDALEELGMQSPLIETIINEYRRIKIIHSGETNEYQLVVLHETLFKITNESRITNEKICTEEIKKAIDSIIFYVFSKCKILKSVVEV